MQKRRHNAVFLSACSCTSSFSHPDTSTLHDNVCPHRVNTTRDTANFGGKVVVCVCACVLVYVYLRVPTCARVRVPVRVCVSLFSALVRLHVCVLQRKVNVHVHAPLSSVTVGLYVIQ